MAIMDQIRCDLKTYLVWKWVPKNGGEHRQNAIRWGSSLRVREGEMAIFVYEQSGQSHDVIYGPFDQIIKTSNLPILSGILGMAYGGDTPFQAEVYFVNLADNIQILFGVPYFDVFDGRYPDLPVPVAARGTMTFKISDYKDFIKSNRLIEFSLMDFKEQIKAVVTKSVRSVIMSVTRNSDIPLVQIQSYGDEINDKVNALLVERLKPFGITLSSFDISDIEIDKSSDGYNQLKSLTIDLKARALNAQTDISIKNMEDSQRINSENMEESMRIQREELQHSQRMQTDSNYFNVHALNTQADVMRHASDAMANMSSQGGMGGGEGGGMNPGGMMAGMMMGSMIGNQMGGMMNQSMQNVNQMAQQSYSQGMNVPPPPPVQANYFVLVNGQQTGPFNMMQLQQMAAGGQLAPTSYVWKNGMPQWAFAQDTELRVFFQQSGCVPPPPPQV